MKLLLNLSFVMLFGILGNSCGTPAPKGRLTYCSYARSGSAGLGKEYCELIADPGEAPKIAVALNIGNRFGDPEIRAEYNIEDNLVDSLQAMLAEAKVYKLNGYNLDEAITGGYSYRIYQEYDSGETVDARWYGHGVKSQAIDAYNMIEHFFQPWRKKAAWEKDPVVEFELSIQRSDATDHFYLNSIDRNEPWARFDLNIDRRNRAEVNDQFDLEADDIKRVQELQEALIDMKLRDLGDYEDRSDSSSTTFWNVELQYSSGAKQTLCFKGDKPDPAVKAACDRILAFFDPWVK